jgi:hypothetical protein
MYQSYGKIFCNRVKGYDSTKRIYDSLTFRQSYSKRQKSRARGIQNVADYVSIEFEVHFLLH